MMPARIAARIGKDAPDVACELDAAGVRQGDVHQYEVRLERFCHPQAVPSGSGLPHHLVAGIARDE